jgi:hypothetical protein
MPRNFQSLGLRPKIQKRIGQLAQIWRPSSDRGSQSIEPPSLGTQNEFQDFVSDNSSLELQRLGRTSSQSRLSNQQGFAKVLLIALLPILLAGIFTVLYAQFYTTAWMRSLHTCRVELLKTQEKTKKDLDTLLKMNPLVRAYRLALLKAQAELVLAGITYNGALAARATADIARYTQLLRQIGMAQKALIMKANLTMSSGVMSVAAKLRQQSAEIQSRLPEFFSFRIHTIRFETNVLAVKPDRSDTASVYELKPQFKDAQSLHVSWTSEFETKAQSRYQWITNHHQKKDSCGATLESKDQSFKEILLEDKSFLKF